MTPPPQITKPALSGLSKTQLASLLQSNLGWEKYRADQIIAWLYNRFSSDFQDWTDLSADKREKLAQVFRIQLLEEAQKRISEIDGSAKYLFSLPDGQVVESVLMRFTGRENLTVCLSSQVGCAVGCPFCATGKLGFKRNLSAQEIVDQVASIQRQTGEKIDNLVYMGQGEPLLNLPEVIESINIFRSIMGIGVRRITVSTSGLVPQIIELGRQKLQINLAVSLHSANQDLREDLVPIAKRWPLHELVKALEDHYANTHRRITFEYTLLAGINDSNDQARALADFLGGLRFPALLNIIPYNETSGAFQRPSANRISAFKQVAERSGCKVTVRATLGGDIEAACGQLANQQG